MSASIDNEGFYVPERVRQRAEQSGPETKKWLKDLPGLINQLGRDWQVSVGTALAGGSAAFVAPAKTADGVACVIKLNMPGDGDFASEINTMIRAAGHGYAKVLRYDFARNAALLEALGPSIDNLNVSPEQSIVLLCQTLQQAWLVPRAASQKVSDTAQGLGQLIAELWEQLDQPCLRAVIDQALAFAERRARMADPGRCVVVHGDPHPANALKVLSPRAGAESGFVFVDPDGFLCEPEYDLGVMLRDWSKQLLEADDPAALAHSYCKLMARESKLDEQAIWEWGFIERVSTGLYITKYGSREVGQPFLDAAERLLRS